jgi:phosphoglycolate phosphatase
MPKSLSLPRALLFDLDGTLADTAPDLAAAVNKMRADRSLDETPFDLLRPLASAGARGLIGAAFGIRPGDSSYEDMRTEFLANYADAIAHHTVLFDGVIQLLEEITEQGLQWGIVTNKPALYTDALIPKIGLQHAACVISGDTTPHAKPHPEPLFEAARQLQIEPQACWYIGDDLRDIQAGRAAGMPTIAAAWGYCGHTEPADWLADTIAMQPLDLMTLLKRS